MMIFKFRNQINSLLHNKFLYFSLFYVLFVLSSLFLWAAFILLPPGFTLAGHDSGLPLDAKQFLLTRLFAWDDRLGFGLDNSAYFGSLTIHFFDFVAAMIGGTPYGGNFISVFFWLGLIFVSAFIFAYQLKNTLGKPFVFILPILAVFNFYIFQSVFMLERAKFGIFSATLISLGMFFRMQQKKSSIFTTALISALAFTIFNGGGWFGVTLYGGVLIILATLIFTSLFEGLTNSKFKDFKNTLLFVALVILLYTLFNTYAILPYVQNFLLNDVPRLVKESSMEGHKDWLDYVSRSTSFINLFRLLGIPDWYGDPSDFGRVNPSHPYAYLYLKNNFLVAISGIFPIFAFASFLLAKAKEQRKILGLFGLIALLELVFAAGSHSPFGILYKFLMDNIPGFFLLRSAFYKFGIFYMLGMMVMFSFTVSFLIEKLANTIRVNHWGRKAIFFTAILTVLGLWLGYNYVLFDPVKIFAWKSDQSTKMQVPSYIYDFEKFVEENRLEDKRILMLPPVNKDWQNDAYNWGYWSLSPLPYALTSVRILSDWHGLNGEEANFVKGLYFFLRANDEKSFSKVASSLDVGYILVREDVLIGSNWSSAEEPQSYKRTVESFKNVHRVGVFGTWSLYKLEQTSPRQIYAVSSLNLISDNFVSLINKFFIGEHSAGFSIKKDYPEILNVSANKAYAYDCLSCLLERQSNVKSLPATVIKPGSLLYYFKERREQEILSTTKDSRSKMGDYLGFILTRSAELRQMVDETTSERLLLESMGVIRSYLVKLYDDIGSSKDNSVDFELLAQVLEYLNPVEREISDYMRGSASRQRSHQFGDEMLGILWDINRIKELFAPILENSDRWTTEKVYKISFFEPGEYNLIFSSEAFSHELDNKVILPKLAKFTKDGEERMIKIKSDKEDWLSGELGFQNEGTGELRLYFEELPNLFSTETSGMEKLFFGKISCFSGPIKNFNRARAYQVSILKSERLRKVQVIFRDKNKVYSDKHGFLKGEDLFEVDSIPQGQFAKYIYFPSYAAKDIYIYICSDDVTPPPVDKVIVREFFIPTVINIRKSSANDQIPPVVEYNRIDPTRYKVRVRDVQGPFILFFNENFNSSWQLSEENGNSSKVVDRHFMIDSYANGWLVNKADTGEFKIEYRPQFMFYIGSVISIGAFLLSISWLIFSRRAKRRERI